MDNLGVNIKPKDAKGGLGEKGGYKLNIVIHVGRGQMAIPDLFIRDGQSAEDGKTS